MKIIFLTNNNISYDLYLWLKEIKHEEVVLIEKKINLNDIKAIKPDFIISYNYKFIITEDIIKHMGNRVINLHISFLPWNRGADPNVWSFLENTKKGITIHLVDPGLDTGDILLRKEVLFDESIETFSSTYIKLHNEIKILFKENWDKIKQSRIITQKQSIGGSFHYVKDLESIKAKIGLDSWDIPIKVVKNKYDDK